MSRRRLLRLALTLLSLSLALEVWLAPADALAQGLTRRPMPTGEVTGLELSLEGATTVARGSSLRWFFTLHEVVGQDRLRPARAGQLRVLASFRPEAAIAELEIDRRGRAMVEVPVPEDAPGSFELVVEAQAARVSRTFRMSIDTTASALMELVPDRATVQPGEAVTVVGRALSLPGRRPLAERQVRLTVTDQDGRALGPERELRTSRTGAFLATVTAPQGAGGLRFSAEIERLCSASASAAVATRTAPRMVLRAVPRQRLVNPAAEVIVDVMARRGDGRPVRGATVLLDGTSPEHPIRTDSAGRAQLRWRAPARIDTPTLDVAVNVTVSRAGLESAATELTVRVARQPAQLGVSVEGGALIPDLPSRLFFRVVNADGTPSRDVPLRLESPLFGELEGRSDASGIAMFDTRPILQPGIESRDRCGGTTASSLVIIAGEGAGIPRIERCVPVDPDATVRVRPARQVVTAGGDPLEVELFVAAAAAREPVELALLVQAGEALLPVSRQVVTSTGGRRSVEVELPGDLPPGELLLRARPLVGASLEPARGGTALVWVTVGQRLEAEASVEGGRGQITLRSPGPGADGVTLFVPDDEAEGLLERLRGVMLPAFGQLLTAPEAAGEPLIAGWLAARTPRDDAAPTVLRDGLLVVTPAPDDPAAQGVLRDPVRARSRFIRGRLALVVRTLERRLEEAIPDHVSDVGVRVSGRWRFNREALHAVIGAHLLANRQPMTLGGDRLTLEDLEQIDRAFTFDNMARRVTRKRLLTVLTQLRRFVRDRELDLWQQGGDPSPWLELLIQESGMSEAALHDGWGRRMAIRRAPGGRARFRFLAPLPQGFELVSAGPDGRFGTSDDVVDPFARVLPSGSAYAEAVGEDDLLSRLNRVEISQATIDVVVRLFEVDSSLSAEGAGITATQRWDDLPSTMPALEAADHFERPWQPLERSPSRLLALGPSTQTSFEVDDEPRRWAAVSLIWTAEGWTTLTRARFRAGFPLVLTSEPLRRLRPGEPLWLPVVGARLADGPEALRLRVEGEGQVRAELEGGLTEASLRLGPGGAIEARIRLQADGEGRGIARVVIEDTGGAGRRVLELPIEVRGAGLLRLQAAAAAIPGSAELGLEVPRDAVATSGVVILSQPSALVADPTLARWREEDPALLAWALTVSGQPIPEELRRQLEAVTSRSGGARGAQPALSTACAAVAWAAVNETAMGWAQRSTAGAVRRQSGEETGAGELELDAAILAALSVAAASEDGSPLSQTIASISDALRLSVRHRREDPALLARGAAALLLADRRDVRGQTMLALARQRLVRGFRGGLVVDLTADDEEEGEPRRDLHSGRAGAEQLIATAALAIAAHQAGDRELSSQLALGLAARSHVAVALGGEPLFWWLAARAFGVFGFAGGQEPLAVTVTLDGQPPRRVELGEEAVTLPLELPRQGRRARLRVTASGDEQATPLVQTVLRYVRPVQAASGGPLQAELSGDVGFAGERAAYLVTVTNGSELTTISLPRLMITLPAGARLDPIGRGAMEQAEGVRAVTEPDPRGVVLVQLDPLGPSGEWRIPLPLRWTAAGERVGPSLATFPADRAWELSITPQARIDVPLRPDPTP